MIVSSLLEPRLVSDENGHLPQLVIDGDYFFLSQYFTFIVFTLVWSCQSVTHGNEDRVTSELVTSCLSPAHLFDYNKERGPV